MERLRHVDGFLSEGAIGDEQDFVRLDARAEPFHFLNQIGVDLKAASRVKDDAVSGRGLRGRKAGRADGRDVL